MSGPDDANRDNPADLLGQILIGFGRLVQGEVALARAEVKRSLRDAAKAMVAMALAAILGITALNVLSGALVAWLVHLGLSPAWGSVVVGAGLLLAALGIVQYARHLLAPENLSPSRSFNNLRRDAETLKSMVTSDAASNNQS
jgi:cytochrome c biogenesis protein CcdA